MTGPDDDSEPAAPADDQPTVEDETIAASPLRELRAKDVLVRSEAELAELEASLDPTELAELSSWFAKPSRVVVEEKLAEHESEDDTRYSERQLKIVEASKAIEPAMIALLERHDAAVARYVRVVEPPAILLDETILRIKIPPADQDAQIGDLRSYERDARIEDALTHSVPQAVLRDLYRDETRFELRFTSPFAEEDAPVDPWVELKAAVREKRTMPELIAFGEVAVEWRRYFRELTDGPWADKVAAVKAEREGQS